jgi:hypothetical protein
MASTHISIDPARGLIRMKLGGHFTIADVQRLEADRRAALRELGCRVNQHLTLCDVSACQLSAPDVVIELQKVIGNPLTRSRKCAMVVRGALARLQARRAVQRDDVAMFDTAVEAEAWLLRGDA